MELISHDCEFCLGSCFLKLSATSIANACQDLPSLYSKTNFLYMLNHADTFQIMFPPRSCSLACAAWTPNTWPLFPRSKLVLASSLFPSRIDAVFTKDTVHRDCQEVPCWFVAALGPGNMNPSQVPSASSYPGLWCQWAASGGDCPSWSSCAAQVTRICLPAKHGGRENDLATGNENEHNRGYQPQTITSTMLFVATGRWARGSGLILWW